MIGIHMLLITCLIKRVLLSTERCPIIDKKIKFSHRGGNINYFQENTLEIFKDSIRQGLSVEIDLMQLASGEVICFHDTNFMLKTGNDLSVFSAKWSQVQKFKYLNSYDDYTYYTNPKVPLFQDVVNELCTMNSTVSYWLDVKYYLSKGYAESILNTFQNSTCACNDNQTLVIEIYDQPNSVVYMKSLLKKYRCKFLFAFGYYSYEADQSYSVIKSELDKYSTYADIFDLEASFYEKFPQLVDELYANGICTSIYTETKGNDVTLFNQYFKINTIITDVSTISAYSKALLENFLMESSSLYINFVGIIYILYLFIW